MNTSTRAITRLPATTFADGITTADLGVPDYAAMLAQHAAYVRALADLGVAVTVLDPLPAFPDAHFVEDTAVIMPEVAVIARPGAAARRGEEEAMQPVLASLRPLACIEAPGTLDGGDVLQIGRHFLVGLSERTNAAGAAQFGRIVAVHGYTCATVPVAAGLHLKSSVNAVGATTLLVAADWADRAELAGYQRIVVDSAETYACNTLLINDHLLMPAGFPATQARLAALGLPIVTVAMSEAQKMDGGLTCLSLRL